VNGRLQPVDTSSTAQPIRFAVALPAAWNRRAIQLGGAGMNGFVPRVAGNDLRQGYVAYGSDSGHANDPKWAPNDEAIRNLGYAQMKKTHDAALVLIERAYGERPAFNYYVGGSQGGREGLERGASANRRARCETRRRSSRRLGPVGRRACASP
jgi:feruloyl esterase